MTAGLRTAGITWGDNDINYIVKMGRRHKENGFIRLIIDFTILPPSFLESLNEMNVLKNNFQAMLTYMEHEDTSDIVTNRG